MIKRLSLKWILIGILLLLTAGGLVAAGRLSAQMIHAQAAPSATLEGLPAHLMTWLFSLRGCMCSALLRSISAEV